MIYRFVLLAASIFCASCSQHTSAGNYTLKVPGEREVPEEVISQFPGLSETEKADCVARGGYIDLVTFNTEGCVVRTKDAGKSCGDSSECEGACLAPLNLEEGTPATGTCAKDAGMFFGCTNIVTKGKAGGEVCH